MEGERHVFRAASKGKPALQLCAAKCQRRPEASPAPRQGLAASPPPRPIGGRWRQDAEERQSACPPSPRFSSPPRRARPPAGPVGSTPDRRQPRGLATPDRVPRRTPGPPATPDRRPMRPQSMDTPPPAPRLFHAREQRDEIGEAVAQGSMPHLMLALVSGHHCGPVLHEAVRHQHIPAVQFILERGHAPDEQWNGRRPLHMAIGVCASEGDPGHCMASMLLKHGACPNARPGDGGTQGGLLHAAAARSSAPAVRLLLENGADPNAKDLCGNAPLHCACQCPPTAADGADPVDPSVSLRAEVAALLLSAGAAPAIPDAAGRPPVALVPGFCAAPVPSCDRLRAMLLGAERQLRRRGLAALSAQLRLGRSERRSACLDCLGGDESKCILEFL